MSVASAAGSLLHSRLKVSGKSYIGISRIIRSGSVIDQCREHGVRPTALKPDPDRTRHIDEQRPEGPCWLATDGGDSRGDEPGFG